MNVYLVRHGETDWNLEGRLMGQTDIPLNKNGMNQAKTLQKKLENIKFDICYTSPLKRAKETAEIICENKCDIIEDDLLKEKCAGKYEGKLKNEIDWSDKDASIEPDEHVFDRANMFLKKIKHTTYGNVLVVSHSGLSKNLHHILQHKQGNIDYNGWQLKNCDFEVFAINEK